MKIGLLGMSFSNPNLGVRALSYTTVLIFSKKYPKAIFYNFPIFSGNENIPGFIADNKISIESFSYRPGLKVNLSNNIFNVLLRAIIFKVFKLRLFKKNDLINKILECDFILDISAGDSFSDIYGIKRYLTISLPKILTQILNIPLILMPQTYGPFSSNLCAKITKHIIQKASMVFSRDYLSRDYIKDILRIKKDILICPDVAFILPAQKVVWDEQDEFVALNISGLLYFQKNDSLGLNCNYKDLLGAILNYFLLEKKEKVVLVPHVLAYKNRSDSDILLASMLIKQYSDANLTMLKGLNDVCELKYIISGAKFFMGSRMHACIGAISSKVPTVCLAYSRKFKGVMETIEYQDYVVDLKTTSEEAAMNAVKDCFINRERLKDTLNMTMPAMAKRIEDALNPILESFPNKEK